MELMIDNYKLVTDKYQYTLYEWRKVEAKSDDEESKEDKEAKEYGSLIGYFTDLEWLLNRLMHHKMHRSSVEDVQELMKLVKETRVFIREAANDIINTINGLSIEERKSLPSVETKNVMDLFKPKESLKPVEIKAGKRGRGKAKAENKAKSKVVEQQLVIEEVPVVRMTKKGRAIGV